MKRASESEPQAPGWPREQAADFQSDRLGVGSVRPSQPSEHGGAQGPAQAGSDADPWPTGRYGVILADPPWRFETWSHRGQGKGASEHYDTMTTADIAAMPVAELAAADCALFMWGCWPHLPDALAVIEGWGFDYKSCGFLWVKQNRRAVSLWPDFDDLFLGLGYGTRGNTEFCLRASRGKPKPLSRAEPQLILSPRREHSRKPDEQYGRIERLYAGPYLELFARQQRAGWDVWGNQTDKFPEAAE